MRREDLELMDAIGSRFQHLKLAGQDLANTAWAFAKMMLVQRPVFEVISIQTLARIKESEPQNLANIAWALATIKWCDEILVNAMAEHCVVIVKQFGPQECANFAWALANLMFVHGPCLAALSHRFVTDGLKTGSTQNLTNTVWAYAQMKVRRTTLFYTVAQEVCRRRGEFRERDLSITAWAFGRLEIREETLILALSREAMSRDFRGKHQEISNLCWAMAQLDLRDTKLMDLMSTAALNTELDSFSSQELANTLWSFASLKVRCEALTNRIAAHVLTAVLPEAISQNIVNIAWALDCLEWNDTQGGFQRIILHFMKVCSRSLGVEWITLASIAKERGMERTNLVPDFWDQFQSLVLGPALQHLAALRSALDETSFNMAFRAMQEWVEHVQLPHLGPLFLTDALAAAGARRAPTAEWMNEARAAVSTTAWWSCPKAAVSSQGVVAYLKATLQVGDRRVIDPGTVFVAEDSPLLLVERLLQPLFLQVPRHGHAERRALVTLLRSVLQSGASDASMLLKDTEGLVQLYASHYLCISCLASVAQLSRHMPKICIEVGCDDAWSSWTPRSLDESHVWASSTTIYLGYTSCKKVLHLPSPAKPNIRPAFLSGCLWALGFACFAKSLDDIGYTATYMLSVIGPVLVSQLISVFVFKEVQEPAAMVCCFLCGPSTWDVMHHPGQLSGGARGYAWPWAPVERMVGVRVPGCLEGSLSAHDVETGICM